MIVAKAFVAAVHRIDIVDATRVFHLGASTRLKAVANPIPLPVRRVAAVHDLAGSGRRLFLNFRRASFELKRRLLELATRALVRTSPPRAGIKEAAHWRGNVVSRGRSHKGVAVDH